ncbi:MAG TPA: hypothetical protein DDW90_08385 [Cyanobacteria bacterium UBA9971]|nr:hypothetical protein [Cyanobacteria bacterium UBA9971]
MISISQKNYVLYEKIKKPVSFGFINGTLVNALSSKALTGGLEYLKQNPVAEVAFLDATTMIAPRTAIDYNQNPVYGTETLFREIAPVVFNPFGPGIIAAIMMNKKGYNGVNAGKDIIISLHEAWKTAGGKNFHPENLSKKEKFKIVKQYVNKILKNTDGVVGNIENNAFVKLKEKDSEILSGRIARIILRNKDEKKDTKLVSKLIKKFTEKYTQKTGADSILTIKIKSGHDFSTDIHTLVEDVISVGKKIFTKTLPDKLESTVDDIVNFSKKKTLWATGLSIAGIIALPAINNTITKLRTGSTGYSAYQDFGKNDQLNNQEKKNKTGLWAAKGIGVAIIGSIMLTTMGAFNKKRGFFQKDGLKNFMDTIELKGKSAHMNLIKLIYGTSLISRVISSRDEQEVKNTTLRDSCGFLNWLVLGGFVSKGIAHLADKKGGSFVNITGSLVDKSKNPIKSAFKTASNWLSNVSQKTHSEMRAMNKTLPSSVGTKNMAIHTSAILGGLVWSMFALGIGMPILNNLMTNKAREKQLKENGRNMNIPNANIHKTSQPTFVSNSSIKNEKSFSDFIKQFQIS